MKYLFIGLALPLALMAQLTVTVPAGTKIGMTLTQPVWMNSAKTGDGIYGDTNFPVVVADRVAVPPGTKVQGVLEVLDRPTRSSDRAEIRLSVRTIVFSNGYAVDTPQAAATFTVLVSKNSDVLLDNGSQIEFTLGQDLVLLQPLPAVKRMPVETSKSATRCKPIPATPGTDPTVIPGTPPSPPMVIPGGPGMPDTVIPGSPGIPDTVIAGSAGTPEIPCPAPPSVSSELVQHTEPLDIKKPVHLGSLTLPKGRYTLRWTGLGPVSDVEIAGHSKTVGTVQARVVGRSEAAAVTKVNATTVQFKGKEFELQFN